jgi:flagella basal body P-ring formation protein FlgA
MKQASDSLLTLCSIPFKAIACIPALPREDTGTNHRHLTPFCNHREISAHRFCILPGMSCPPRSFVRSRWGEERIRSLLHGICLLWMAVCVTGPSFWTVLGAENVVIRLKEEAAVRSDTVYLKDVADLQGSDPAQLDKLSQIPLGPSPEFGMVKTLSRHQIEGLVPATVGPLPAGSLIGAPAVQIRLQGRQIDFDKVATLLLAHLLKTTSWKESEIKICSINNLKGMELPPGDVFLRLSTGSAITRHKDLLVPIEIVQADKVLRSFWITARIAVRAEILTAARKIPRGKVVDAGDVVKKTTDIQELDAIYIRNLEEVLGRAARENFSPGDPLLSEGFMKPFLVMRGETVQLRLERNGIVLTSPVRAEQDGRLGQVIKVRNLDFSTILKAQVTGRAKVELQ